MALYKAEKYTPLFKGYLTFPHNPIIKGVFLKEEYDTRYEITIDGVSINEYKITPKMREEIIKIGGTVKSVKVLGTTGKNEIKIGVAPNEMVIPVQVRKVYNNKKIDIRVRVTGDTMDDCHDKIDILKKELGKYGVKPKVCLWDRVGQLK